MRIQFARKQDPVGLGEGTQRQGLDRRQRVVVGQQHPDGIRIQCQRMQRRVGRGEQDEHHIQMPCRQRLDQGPRGTRPQRYLQVRELAPESTHARRQEHRGGGIDITDAQPAGPTRTGRSRDRDRVAEARQQIRGLRIQHPRRGRRPDPARSALEQADAQLALEYRNPLGQGGLGQMQRRGRAAEVARVEDGDERPQMREIESERFHEGIVARLFDIGSDTGPRPVSRSSPVQPRIP